MKKDSRTFIVVAALLFSAFPLSAQSTWNGLRFGMSQVEVEQALKDKQMTISERKPEIFSVQPTYQVVLPDLIKPLPFNVELTMSRGKLSSIDLQLDKEALMKRMGGDLLAVVTLVNDSMKAALSAKYGKPIAVEGACDTLTTATLIHNDSVDCKESWQTEGQLISVSWSYNNFQHLDLYWYFLSYQAPSPSL